MMAETPEQKLEVDKLVRQGYRVDMAVGGTVYLSKHIKGSGTLYATVDQTGQVFK